MAATGGSRGHREVWMAEKATRGASNQLCRLEGFPSPPTCALEYFQQADHTAFTQRGWAAAFWICSLGLWKVCQHTGTWEWDSDF